ncbi:MAG: ABC transporter permease subunit [Verrucomicrobia bacterium]|nr:ABC transporter permease subunit [Verrucomicrobiota bacterium]
MTFLPIVERELTVASRLPKTYRDRWLNTAAMLGLFLLVYATGYRQTTTALGGMLFQTFSVVMFISSLCYCFITADSISSEKRDGTLGLLFLTDLRGYDIVFGKLAATSLNSVYHLLAVFPVLSLPLLMGGVSGGDFWRMQLAILNAMFFSLSAGMLVSVLSWHARKALVGAGVLVAALTLGVPLLESEALRPRVNDVELFSQAVSPGFAFTYAMEGRGGIAEYWLSLSGAHLLAWLFLIGACFFVQRCWQERTVSARRARWSEKLKRWSLGDAEQRRAYREKMFSLPHGPVCWLDDRYRLQKTFLWGALLAFVTVWMWNFKTNPWRCLQEENVVLSGLSLHYGLLVWIAFQAANRFVEDRRGGALELLLATPVSVEEILRGRMAALRRQFGWPIIAVLAFDLSMAVGAFYKWPGYWNDDDAARVLVLHWVVSGASIVIRITISPSFTSPWSPWLIVLLVWLGWGLALSLFFGLMARRKLRSEFRELAACRFDAPAESWFARWKRGAKQSAQPMPSTLS